MINDSDVRAVIECLDAICILTAPGAPGEYAPVWSMAANMAEILTKLYSVNPRPLDDPTTKESTQDMSDFGIVK